MFSTMGALLFASPMIFLLWGLFVSASIVSTMFGALIFFVTLFTFKYLLFYIKELISQDQRPPVTGLMLNLLIHFSRLFDYQTSLAKKYRTFRLLQPSCSEIFTTDPVNIEHILKTNFSNYGKGDYNWNLMRDLFGDGIFAVDGDKWRHQRKLASYEFSTKILRDFSSAVFRANAAKLTSKISVAAAAKQAIDMQDVLLKSSLDSIFKVGFGVELNSLSGSDDFGNQFTKAFDDSNFIVYCRYVDVFWKLKRYLNIGLEASLKRNIKLIDNFIFELIRCKKEQMKNVELDRGKEDILSRFLLESEKDPESMTDKYLRDITLNFIIAGKDTTANTLTWFFYMLCKHPLIQEKAALDVREATEAQGNLCADEFAKSVTEAALDKMHYLHAALSETLRLYPAVPVVISSVTNNYFIFTEPNLLWSPTATNRGLGPSKTFKFFLLNTKDITATLHDGKNAAEDDILPDGFKVKKGDGVNYMTYAMGRMTYIWGEDAEEFRPERWLLDGVFRSESPYKFTAFQAGPRICPGKEFAYRQMKILAAVLLQFFGFKLVDETKEATYRTMFTLHMDKGLRLYAYPR